MMSTKNKAQVQQDALAVDEDVDEKESTSPARRPSTTNAGHPSWRKKTSVGLAVNVEVNDK
jgi:hypothetical protein